MQWINDINQWVLLTFITSTIIFLGGLLGFYVRYRHKLNFMLQENKTQVLLKDQEIEQLKQRLASFQVELDTLDLARDKSELTARQLHGELMAANERLSVLARLQQEKTQLQQQNQDLQAINHELQASLREKEAHHEQALRAAEEKLSLLEKAEQRLKMEFEHLANQVFEQKVKSVDEQNKQSLNSLLSPLKEQLQSFKKQVSDNYYQEAKERHTLTHEIKQLQKLNQQMAQDAVNLTQALKGDNKQQGNWGEVVLAKVLQDSGLREGYEYVTQMSLTHPEGKRYQPDVVINLPDNKQVIIDAKMAFVAFERYFSAQDKTQKAQALSEHLLSVRSHIKQLSQKNYHELNGVTSLDYVLMFIPLEPAFQLAIEKDPKLINEAMAHNIMLVSPTTLLVALRTIHHLWRNERQHQNAKLIAEKASKLYDKMRLFVDDMVTIGQALKRAQTSYDGAMNKLSLGRGNLIRQAEEFKDLGVEVKKHIHQEITEIAQNESDNHRQVLEDKVNY